MHRSAELDVIGDDVADVSSCCMCVSHDVLISVFCMFFLIHPIQWRAPKGTTRALGAARRPQAEHTGPCGALGSTHGFHLIFYFSSNDSFQLFRVDTEFIVELSHELDSAVLSRHVVLKDIHKPVTSVDYDELGGSFVDAC